MHLRFWPWQASDKHMLSPEEILSGMYNRAATHWDAAITRMGYPRAYDRLFARLGTTTMINALTSDGLVLDAGIGTGALSAALETHIPAVRIVGVDVADAMLSIARQRVARLVDTHQASITRLPFPDQHFDLVMTAHVLEHLPVTPDGITEMLRVLKSGHPFVMLVTWPCPMTRLLSVRWKFAAISERSMRYYLKSAGIETVDVSTLTRPLQAAYMSRVYVGHKP